MMATTLFWYLNSVMVKWITKQKITILEKQPSSVLFYREKILQEWLMYGGNRHLKGTQYLNIDGNILDITVFMINRYGLLIKEGLEYSRKPGACSKDGKAWKQ